MSLEDNFHQVVQEWIEHCRNPHVQVNSSSESVKDCDSYNKIISMGKEALPLIRKLYDADESSYVHGQNKSGEYAIFSTEEAKRDLPLSMIKGHGLVAVVKEIVGDDFQIPEELRGKISAVEDYTRRWLNENMIKYCPPCG